MKTTNDITTAHSATLTSKNEVLVEVTGLSKKFCKDLKTSLWYGAKDLVAGYSGNKKDRQLRPKEFWAVKDISFTLKRGECLGLIGHNGAGKSTLLKILNGLINPDEGQAVMRGRIGALIELGAGFNPILTGRENIYNNGAVLGFSRKEVDAKLEKIIDFAEMSEFIDMPVQNYSSGMKVRLGFGIAAEMEPDILLIDEVLAVGDAGFRMKSYNKLTELMSKCAVIFVSHSMQTIARVCTHGMLMQKGEMKFFSSNMHEVVEKYFDVFQGEQAKIEFNDFAEIDKIKVNGKPQNNQKEVFDIQFGEDLILDLHIRIKSNHPKFLVKMTITDKDMKMVAHSVSNRFHKMFNTEKKNHIQFKFPKITLIDGEYAFTFFIQHENETKPNNTTILATYRNYTKFKVRGLKEVLYAPYYLIPEIKQNTKTIELTDAKQ